MFSEHAPNMRHRLISLLNTGSYFLFGPRVTGKSTLIRHELTGKNALWLDLLNASQEQRYLETPDLLSAQIKGEGNKLD